MSYVVLTGRMLYVAIFIMGGLGHFSQQTIGYAAQHGVPMAGLLVVFLVPVTVMMHNFWTAVADLTGRAPTSVVEFLSARRDLRLSAPR
ncbi:MAG: hypothetical protein ACREJ6_11070 [Candidatus Methylomirabilis sp.]